MEEQEAFEAMIELYVGYELGQLSEDEIERFEQMDGVKEHVQSLIAKSFIAATISKEVESNSEFTPDNMSALIVDTINSNFNYGFCEVFKEENNETETDDSIRIMQKYIDNEILSEEEMGFIEYLIEYEADTVMYKNTKLSPRELKISEVTTKHLDDYTIDLLEKRIKNIPIHENDMKYLDSIIHDDIEEILYKQSQEQPLTILEAKMLEASIKSANYDT